MTTITRATPATTWKAVADVPARRKTAYAAKEDKLATVHEDPAIVGEFELTINWAHLLYMLASKAARSKGKKAKAMSGAVALKFKGPAK